jgi:catechol 2,3-dioxygenase-like lactoylglutathione lyase family enzyme
MIITDLPADELRPDLVPELLVSSLPASLAVWRDLFGFAILYDRPEEGFAYLRRGKVEVMLEERRGPSSWDVGPLERPFGRGINFEITVEALGPLLSALDAANYPLFIQPQERWYRANAIEIGVRQFLITDPDGYLIRFSEPLGTRPRQT